MNSRYVLTTLALLAAANGAQAQQPTTSPVQINVGGKVDLGAKEFSKGWYLYWPAEALNRPRLPMPFPYWPQQGTGQAPAIPGPNTPPGPLQLPRDQQALPPLPGSSWAPNPYNSPFQPVSYPVYVPGYWYYQ